VTAQKDPTSRESIKDYVQSAYKINNYVKGDVLNCLVSVMSVPQAEANLDSMLKVCYDSLCASGSTAFADIYINTDTFVNAFRRNRLDKAMALVNDRKIQYEAHSSKLVDDIVQIMQSVNTSAEFAQVTLESLNTFVDASKPTEASVMKVIGEVEQLCASVKQDSSMLQLDISDINSKQGDTSNMHSILFVTLLNTVRNYITCLCGNCHLLHNL
jgi:hypothetical protein